MFRYLCCIVKNPASWMRNHRMYHSKHGVYGYQPRLKHEFKVSADAVQSRNRQANTYRWIEAYRRHGHKLASVNPININGPESLFQLQELQAEFYGLQPEELITPVGLISMPSTPESGSTTVRRFETLLQEIYCNSGASAEFSYVENLEEREWLASQFEQLPGMMLKDNELKKIAELLIKSQAWDNFVAIKFPTVKRYGGEGAESLLAFYWELLRSSAKAGIEHIVVAMPHRGRTSLQTTLLKVRPAKVFHKLRGESEFPNDAPAMGDILTHFHVSENLVIAEDSINLSMVRNPSHLEAANAIAMGKTRSKQQCLRDGAFSENASRSFFANKVINVSVHGDAAFTGQGINQECLNLAYVPHFEVGGTIHLIVNNQLGFTTPGDRGRSSLHPSDLAKTIQAPVFHVNGDNPELVALVTKLALDYWLKFNKDVFIDMNCFRRWGHNEMDDPTFTSPALYRIIQNRKSVPDLFTEKLNSKGIQFTHESIKIRETFLKYLDEELEQSKYYIPEPSYFQKQWAEYHSAPESITYWDTGLDYSLLNYIGYQSVAFPEDFQIHPHLLKTHVQTRRQKLDTGKNIDWSTAEALAIGSLLYQGHNVRISGQDTGRGTFSQRHAMLVDQKTNEMYIPLNDLVGGHGGKLELAQSILSEEAVLGFEYGMAIDNPNNLIIWEAQFGDFANGAQIIIDNFIFSGECKWMESNGLVMLLPHGYDGMGSEHSSCRIERYLQLSSSRQCKPDGDDVNVNIVNPTTPAQYFHVLRRQLLRSFRKPLIVVAPKTLLRLSSATSRQEEFQPGTFFQNVLGDTTVDADEVRRVIFCSGKHYYNLHEQRQLLNETNTAIIRLECLCPFPLKEIQDEIGKYKRAQNFIWSQEEHRNMGAWNFVQQRFEHLIGKQIIYSGREEAATTATGIGKIHKQEAAEVVTKPFRM